MTPAFSSVPPVVRRLAHVGKLEAGRGREARPSLCGIRPVALHTAVISMPDLVPSTKLLNIFGLIEARSSMRRYLSRMSHTVSGVEAW